MFKETLNQVQGDEIVVQGDEVVVHGDEAVVLGDKFLMENPFQKSCQLINVINKVINNFSKVFHVKHLSFHDNKSR